MDRRNITDFWARLLFYLNILAWMLLVFMLVIFHQAQPEFDTVFDRFYQLNLRTDWDIQYLYYLIYTVVFGIFTCLSGLLLGVFRGRRENDHKKALIITGIISFVMLVAAINVV